MPNNTHNDIVSRILKFSSVGEILELFDIAYHATNDTNKSKTFFVDCPACCKQARRTISYYSYMNDWQCISGKSCPNKTYAKDLIGLILMHEHAQNKKNATAYTVCTKINKRLNAIEEKLKEIKAKLQTDKHLAQYGIYRIHDGAIR